LESALAFRIGRAHRALREVWEVEIADLGLTPPQARMLRAVCEWPGSGVRELARRLRADAMNAKHLGDHLEGLGLVRSECDPHHRQRRLLCPTDQGIVLAEELNRRTAAWQRRLSRLLGAAELAELHRLLDRVEQVASDLPSRRDPPRERTRPR
jgi:DNA-binding MarR family transcriptional regulator